jgi:hypothetical protein
VENLALADGPPPRLFGSLRSSVCRRPGAVFRHGDDPAGRDDHDPAFAQAGG